MSDPAARSEAILKAHYPERIEDHFAPITVGTTTASMDEGAGLILDGIKTVTSTAQWEWPNGQGPFVGALSVLFDGQGDARAIIETTAVERCRFGDVTEELAQAYGEGERSLAWWRREMGEYYRCIAEASGQPFGDDTVLYIERLAVARRLQGGDVI